MLKRLCSFLLILLFLLNLTVGVVLMPVQAKANAKPGSKGKVVFWGGWLSPDDFKDFENETGYKVNYPERMVDMSKLIAAIASGNAPDAIFIYLADARQLMGQGLLRPLDDFVAKSKDVSWNDFIPVTVKWGEYKGKHYLFPWDLNCDVLFWNRKMFEQAGLDPDRPPQTWDELLKLVKFFTKYNSEGKIIQTGVGSAGNWGLDTFIWQLGADWIDKNGRSQVKSTAIRKAVEFVLQLRKLADPNVLGDKIDPKTQLGFDKQNVAMWIDDVVWRVNDIFRKTPGLDYDVTLLPVPKKGMKKGAVGYATWSLALPQGSKNPQAGFEIAKYFATKVPYTWVSEGLKANKKNPAPYTIAYKKTLNLVKEILPQIQDPVHKRVMTHRIQILEKYTVYEVKDVLFNPRPIVDPILDKVWKGQMGVQQALNEADKQLTAAILDYKKKMRK